jgi:valyl-tRNA synthetase
MKNIFKSFLNILYPFCPFISLELKEKLEPEIVDKLFTKLPQSLNISYKGDFDSEIQLIKDFTIGIRSLRKNLLISPSEKIVAYYSTNDKNNKFLEDNKFIVENLCNLESLNLLEKNININLISNLTPSGTISFEKRDDLDFTNQISKLNKDLVSLEKALNLSVSKLNNKGFLESAPDNIIKEEKDKKVTISASIKDIRDLIFQLQS